MIFFSPVIVKHVEKYPDMTNPRYNEHIFPVPWYFVISGPTVVTGVVAYGGTVAHWT